MPIKFKLSPKVNSLKNPPETLYYPRAVKRAEIGLHEIAENISEASSLTRADVHAVIIALTDQLVRYLDNGYIVRIGEFGTFQVSLQGKGTDDPNALGKNLIKSAKVNFRAGQDIKSMLNTLQYQRLKRDLKS